MGVVQRSIVLAFIVSTSLAPACGGDDGEGTPEGTATDATDPTMSTGPTTPSSTDADTSVGSADTGPDTEGCGNGVLEGDEQCDDGDANSDRTPDACRTDCRTAHCADGVVDPGAGEECDDGNANAQEPNACRETCLLPSCGDNVQDTGEPCDDGNELWGDTCFACSNLWYFVLDSPDLTGAGDVSILRSTREGPPVSIIGGDPSLNGIVQLALAPAGVTLFALQSQGDVDRVLAFDPVDGGLLEEFAVDTAVLGYSPELQAIARGSDGLLWIAVLGEGATRLVSLDPATGAVVDATAIGGGLGVADMTADDAGSLYFSRGDEVMRVDLATLGVTTFGDAEQGLDTPIGLAYDPVQGEIWVANNAAASPSQMFRADLAGTFMPFSIAGDDPEPYVRGVAIDIGGVVLTTQRDYDRVVAVQNFDAIQEFFTEAEMVVAPTDLEILNMMP